MSDDKNSSKGKYLERLRVSIQQDFSDLQVTSSNGKIVLKGTFPVSYKGRIVDRYQVEIQVPPDFPLTIPILRETGGRIPWVSERHVNNNGDACLLVPEEWMLSSEAASLIAFLKGPVHNFFIGQSLVERGEPWPFGERPHGIKGLIESYRDLLGLEDDSKISDYLYCLSFKEYKGHHRCPCGSNEKIRKCHEKEILKLREKIPYRVAKKAFARIQEQRNK